MIRRPPSWSIALLLVLLAAARAAHAVVVAGEVSQVDAAPSCANQTPDVAPLADGGFIAVWQGTGARAHDPSHIFGQFLDHDGRPRGPQVRLDDGNPSASAWGPDVATDAAGNFMVAWSEHLFETAVKGRVFSAFGVPLGASFVIAPDYTSSTEVIAERDGGFTVLWQVSSSLFRRRYTAGGQPLGPAEALTNDVYSFDYGAAAHDDNGTVAVWVNAEAQIRAGIFYPGAAPVLFRVHTYTAEARNRFVFIGRVVDVASRADGTFLVSWRDIVNGRPAVFVRAYDGEGQPLGEAGRADDLADAGPLDLAGIASTADASGDFLVAWQGNPAQKNALRTLYVRAFGPDGAPRGPVREVGDLAREPSFPVLVSSSEGGSLLVWQDGQPQDLGTPPIPVCFSDGIYAQPLLATCTGGENLCLQDGRFQVRVSWALPGGQRGQGQAVGLTRESGYFWFFGANNVEVAVKILDGRIENGHFWVFYGSLSDVGYTITIDDTVTGATKTYVNPHSTLASRSDTTAFPAAPAASNASVVAASAPSHLPPADVPGPCSGPSPIDLRRPGLCLNGQRFEVDVAWHDPFHGTSGIATGVLLTEDSGYFWFFGEDNLELVVKVLDGRPINGQFWVFYGALTNVEYTVRVRHVDSGAERIYHNPPFLFRSHSDINAFSIAE